MLMSSNLRHGIRFPSRVISNHSLRNVSPSRPLANIRFKSTIKPTTALPKSSDREEIIASARPNLSGNPVSTRGHQSQAHRILESWYADKPIFQGLVLDRVSPFPDNDLASTRPAPLNPPEPLNPADFDGAIPLGTRASYLFRLGKAYLTFYKTGLKSTWANYKLMRNIEGRLKGTSLEDAAFYGGQPVAEGLDIKVPRLSRKEYQLCLRTRHDIKKLLPFGLVFCIFGEFTPLVILFIGSSIVPYTCRIPKQVAHDHDRFGRMLPLLLPAAEDVAQRTVRRQRGELKATNWPKSVDGEMEERFITLKAYKLGVYPFPRPPTLPGLGWLAQKLWIRPRLAQRTNEIMADMVLIRREGGYARLEPIEVFECALRYFDHRCIAELYRRRQQGLEIDPFSQELKNTLVPLLEQRADEVFSHDYTRIHPNLRELAIMMDDFGIA